MLSSEKIPFFLLSKKLNKELNQTIVMVPTRNGISSILIGLST
jgi:hypothetical protein